MLLENIKNNRYSDTILFIFYQYNIIVFVKTFNSDV